MIQIIFQDIDHHYNSILFPYLFLIKYLIITSYIYIYIIIIIYKVSLTIVMILKIHHGHNDSIT